MYNITVSHFFQHFKKFINTNIKIIKKNKVFFNYIIIQYDHVTGVRNINLTRGEE